jgi:hypothetical protein
VEERTTGFDGNSRARLLKVRLYYKAERSPLIATAPQPLLYIEEWTLFRVA